MAVVTRVKRLVANPHRRHRRKKSNPRGHRRKMTAKQIRFFGTKRQKAALKRKRRKVFPALSTALAANPRRKRTARRRKAPAKRHRKLNPALLITLGAANPRGGSSMAQRRKKAHRKAAHNPRRRRRATRVLVAAAPRRHNAHRRRRHHNPRRRHHNPAFGMRGMGMTKAVIAGMAGMAVAKFLPTVIPGNLVQGNIMRVVATGASAFVAQALAKAVKMDASISDAVLFGGLIQTGSVALNSFLPGLAGSLGLSGIMDGNWTIPENPLKQLPLPPAPTEAGSRIALSGLQRAYGTAF